MEAGRKVEEVAREMDVSKQMTYAWKSKYGGMEVSEAKRLRALEEEGVAAAVLYAHLVVRVLHKMVAQVAQLAKKAGIVAR
mgnify:CR=1 FL=1